MRDDVDEHTVTDRRQRTHAAGDAGSSVVLEAGPRWCDGGLCGCRCAHFAGDGSWVWVPRTAVGGQDGSRRGTARHGSECVCVQSADLEDGERAYCALLLALVGEAPRASEPSRYCVRKLGGSTRGGMSLCEFRWKMLWNAGRR